MADQAVISALAFLHIVSAIAWFGGVVFFVSSVAPGLRKMSIGARIEFSARIGPGIVRFYGISGTLTIVFGLGLLYEAFGGNPSAWPVSIEIGFSLGFLAYLLALVVTVPASRRLDKISQELVKNPNAGPPPPEFVKNFQRLGMGAIVIAILLLLATVFMVSTAFPF
ncbi:MAG: hypothetical protein OK452_00875 [Thaumarchaeota archaeon]|nr:hypothetical protein [Nitrososphaerota archaeon]